MTAEFGVARSGGSGCEFDVSTEAEFGELISNVCSFSRRTHLASMYAVAREHGSKRECSSWCSLSNFGRASYNIGVCGRGDDLS